MLRSLRILLPSCCALAPLNAQVAKPTASANPTRTQIQRLKNENDSLRRLLDSLTGRSGAGAPLSALSLSNMEVAATPSSQGAPFGLTIGMSEKALRSIAPLDSVTQQRGVYTIRRVPKPAPEFESYALVVSPKQGLCKVSATGRDITSSSHGADMRSAFNGIRESVSEKYGSGKTLDFLMAGSIWDEPRDWMMGLLKKERVLSVFWSAKEGARLPPSISAIALEASALSTGTGYVRLSFEFNNFTECLAELKVNPY